MWSYFFLFYKKRKNYIVLLFLAKNIFVWNEFNFKLMYDKIVEYKIEKYWDKKFAFGNETVDSIRKLHKLIPLLAFIFVLNWIQLWASKFLVGNFLIIFFYCGSKSIIWFRFFIAFYFKLLKFIMTRCISF